MNQKRAVQPTVYFHHFLGVNLEPLRSCLAGRAQQVLAYYLLSGLLMRCSAWKQWRDPLSACLLRLLQGTRLLVTYIHQRFYCIISSDSSLSPIVDEWLRRNLISLTDVLGDCLAPNTPLLRTFHNWPSFARLRGVLRHPFRNWASPFKFPKFSHLLLCWETPTLKSLCSPVLWPWNVTIPSNDCRGCVSYYHFYLPSSLPTILQDMSEGGIGEGDFPKACKPYTASLLLDRWGSCSYFGEWAVTEFSRLDLFV